MKSEKKHQQKMRLLPTAQPALLKTSIAVIRTVVQRGLPLVA